MHRVDMIVLEGGSGRTLDVVTAISRRVGP